jgi:hypothetical protein
MADVTINGLAAYASPQAGDFIGVWDIATSQYKKVTRSNLVGVNIIGGGSISLGGFTLTVPQSGTAALLERTNVFTVRQTLPAVFSGATGSIGDDFATSFTPAYTSGMLLIWTYSTGGISAQRAALFSYRAAATPHCQVIVQGGTAFEASTAALAGTTGTDVKVTVSAASDGKIYVENRSGVTMNHGYLIVGGT